VIEADQLDCVSEDVSHHHCKDDPSTSGCYLRCEPVVFVLSNLQMALAL